MKIGCGTVLFREFSLESALEAIRAIGYEYFETQAVGPWCPHVDVMRDDPEKLVQLKNKLGFKGITGLWSLNGNIISNENAVSSGIRSVEWAAAAGIPVLHTGDGSKPQGMSDEEAFKIFADKLAPILETARKHRITVAIEPHGAFSLTADGLIRMMELGESAVLGINYDACNIFRSAYVESGNGKSGWSDADSSENELEVLRLVRDRVVHFHAKDIDAYKKCVPLGEGCVNIKGCLEYLKNTAYDGAVSVETEGSGDFDTAAELARKSYRYLTEFAASEPLCKGDTPNCTKI